MEFRRKKEGFLSGGRLRRWRESFYTFLCCNAIVSFFCDRAEHTIIDLTLGGWKNKHHICKKSPMFEVVEGHDRPGLDLYWRSFFGWGYSQYYALRFTRFDNEGVSFTWAEFGWGG